MNDRSFYFCGLLKMPSHPDIKTPTPRSGNTRRWIILTIACGLLGLVFLFLLSAEDTIDVEEKSDPAPLQPVTVEKVGPTSETTRIISYAEVRPRWSANLKAAISGRVTHVTKDALTGSRIQAGTPLLDLEKSRYKAEVAAAELAVKQTELALWQARNAATVARKTFERSGRKAPNDLALKLPQLAIAKFSVASAKARLASARQQLRDTTINAPFSGFVTKRYVSPGQSVSPGDQLVRLVDDTSFELTVELGKRDWDLLANPIAGRTAEILNPEGQKIATARIREAGGFLDSKTRQYRIFLEIRKPAPGTILSGDFVKVRLPGKELNNILDIPASAVTREGMFWYVNPLGRLQRAEAHILYQTEKRVFIKAPDQQESWRISITPLQSFLPGQYVRSIEQEG